MLDKIRGTLTELAFVSEAYHRGAHVISIPVGDCAPYDVLIQPNQNKPKYFRVQVKTARKTRTKDTYRLTTSRKTKNNENIPYTAKEIDFFATELQPSQWLIIPINQATTPFLTITKTSHSQFINNWKQLNL